MTLFRTQSPLRSLPSGPRSRVAVVAAAVAIVLLAAAGMALEPDGEPARGRWVAASPSPLGSPSAGPQVAATNTVRVDMGAAQGPLPFRPGRALSATPNSWRYGSATTQKLEALQLDVVRVWLKFEDSYDVELRDPRYERWHAYLDTHARLAKTMLVNWRSGYDPIVTKKQMTEAELFAAERDMLAHYKQRYPQITQLEVENEPADLDVYYPKYRFMYQVVNAVNALGLAGPRIEIGGPVLDAFSAPRLQRFLALYRADKRPDKRLDFLAYHQYLTTTEGHWSSRKDEPSMVATERADVDRLCRGAGVPSLPVYVTESGVFPALRASHPDVGLGRDLLIQAAGMASIHYFYAGQARITPFHWTVDHPENDRKDLFSNTDTGAATPYYKMVRMQSMLPATRYPATSDALTGAGIGVYGLAAADARTIAVMTWNYQWTGTRTHQSRVIFENLPRQFREARLRVDRYKVSAELNGDDLAKVDSFEIGERAAAEYVSPTVKLGPNELQLLVLTRL